MTETTQVAPLNSEERAAQMTPEQRDAAGIDESGCPSFAALYRHDARVGAPPLVLEESEGANWRLRLNAERTAHNELRELFKEHNHTWSNRCDAAETRAYNLQNELDEARADLELLQLSTRWIRVGEALPDCGRYLVVTGWGAVCEADYTDFYDGFAFVVYGGQASEALDSQATHWKPLPAPPSEVPDAS